VQSRGRGKGTQIVYTAGKNTGSSLIRSWGTNRTAMIMPSRYGHLVEFGTHGTRHWKGGKSTGVMPAHPFMIPAAEAERSRYLERCKGKAKEAERDLSVSRLV